MTHRRQCHTSASPIPYTPGYVNLPDPLKTTLQSRVDLVRNIGVCPRVPFCANIVYRRRNRESLDIFWPLQDVDVQSPAHVPSNVAMRRPDCRVVLLKLEHDIGRNCGALCRLHELDISPLCIGWVNDRAVPVAKALGEDVKVVTMYVDGVSAESEEVPEDKADRRVGAEVIDVPFGWEGQVACIDIIQHWAIVDGTEAAVVHEPDEIGTVALKHDVDVRG